MLPHEVIRAAANLIRAGGLSKGAAARDAYGKHVQLFGGTRGDKDVDTSRASLNGAAVQFSIYGALAAVMNRTPCNPSAVWPLLRIEAEKALEGKARPGGTNHLHLHPVMALSELAEMDTDGAVAFLEGVADKIAPAKAEEKA